jgi:N6-adenosine-specific RNA methylase IME4
MMLALDAARPACSLQFHPLSDIFPLIKGREFRDLVADIKAHGLREPIVVHQSKILDGRSRYSACIEAGVTPITERYNGADPLSYVISLNLKRRHLSESQRAMVAAKLANMRRGERTDLPSANLQKVDRASAAKMLNVSERSVASAHDVHEHGAPELTKAVEHGDIAVSTAADLVALSVHRQQEIVARGPKEILEAAKAIRAKKAKERYAARVARLAEVSAYKSPLTSKQRYPIILADPPWDYQFYNETTGSARAAAEHYPTMKLGEICSLPIANITTDDAILFLWTTAPHLQESFDVLAAWGFEYKTNVVWVKDKIGLGYFIRGQHELLLIATRGDMPSPLPGNRPPSVITASRREHSRKPDEAYGFIEGMYPELPKIELFARRRRSGWAAWGNQLSEAAQ